MKPANERRRERILLMGGPGSGKTRGWLTVADWLRKTKSSSHVWVIDTDDAVGASIEEFPRLMDWDQLHAYDAFTYDQYRDTIKEIVPQVKRGDFVVVDLMDKAWEASQDYYSTEVYGQSKAEYFLARRSEMKKNVKNFQPYEGWTDWTIIKPMYNEFVNHVFYKHPGHVIVCTGIKALDRKTDKKDIVEMFGSLGFKPGGEKNLPHAPSTVLLMSWKGDDRWTIDTAKDRGGREYLTGTEVRDIVRDYLVPVGGWSLK